MTKQGDMAPSRAAGSRFALRLAASAGGRILLHVAALARDGELRWHLRGIARELARRVLRPRVVGER